MRRKIAVAVVLGVLASVPAGSGSVAVAKPCSAGWTHAVLRDGAHKCLRAGQYCATRHESVYRSKGYTCRGGRLKRR